MVAVGKGKRLDDSKLVALDVQVGDCILFGWYSGGDIKLDGQEYMTMFEQAGGRTLAQDQATSLIFGMPQEAIRIGAAEGVVGLQDFAPRLMALAGIVPPL